MVLETALQVFRAMAGVLLTLFIPGFALVLALYPRKKDIGTVERIALSSVLSIAVTVLTALFLDFVLGIDFTSTNMVIALLLFSALCTVLWLIETRGRLE